MNTPSSPVDLTDLTLDELAGFVEGLDLKPFRAKQLFSWLYRPGFTDFSQMTDIAKEVRALIAEKARFTRLTPHAVERSRDGTVKFGFKLADGAVIESVLIPEEERRRTLCVSSQVGCAMKCGFCLTGTMGFSRNLRVAEIVGQVTAVNQWLCDQLGQPGRHVNNLVFMGMGEPLLNFDNLTRAVRILLEPLGHNFSGRRITVSTCGIAPRIKQLGEAVPVNLAISLHAPDDELRNRLMPVNRTYPLSELLDACRSFPLPPRRRIMMEYVLIRGVNDSPAQARRLVKILHGIRCKVNLLPYNETKAFDYKRPSDAAVEAFRAVLKRSGITTLVRDSRGGDISAACGQLAATHTSDN